MRARQNAGGRGALDGASESPGHDELEAEGLEDSDRELGEGTGGNYQSHSQGWRMGHTEY